MIKENKDAGLNWGIDSDEGIDSSKCDKNEKRDPDEGLIPLGRQWLTSIFLSHKISRRTDATPKDGNKLTKSLSVLKKLNSFNNKQSYSPTSTSEVAISDTVYNNNNEESFANLHPVYIGKSRR
ncbi:hypothetical protein V6N13_126456 [Hibiscus sabdariffa]|uniref:Uncharacterized protein n=1 Tax=Hibiscus sabdariffa TaxID=183260 RepID=A0ABR2RFF6_9ROSI